MEVNYSDAGGIISEYCFSSVDGYVKSVKFFGWPSEIPRKFSKTTSQIFQLGILPIKFLSVLVRDFKFAGQWLTGCYGTIM